MKRYQSNPRRTAGQPAAMRAAVSFTLSALAAWSYTPAHAQASANAAADGALAPVVVSASRFPNDPAFPPVAATVITAEQIREAGIDNANEAIRKLGGVYGRQSSAGPNDFPLDLRGFGSNGDQNMVVLVDGVRISENELTTPLLSSIPIETIERIEIVRGGSSVLYGSGATGGTIQIITKRPQANAGHGSVVAEVGTDGQRAGRAFVARGWDNMSIDASYAKAHNDGWRDNTKSNQENFSTTVQWFASDWRFGLRANIARADYGLAGGLSLAQFNANPRQAKTPFDYGSYDNDSITAFLERRFGAFDVAAELSHREKIARANYASTATTLQTNVRNTQFSPRIRHVLEAGPIKNELIAGIDLAEWNLNTVASYGNSDAAQRSKAFYLRDEIEFDKNARIAAGVRREIFTQSSVSGVYGMNSGVNAWDLQASYALVPSLRAFAKTGQSYRLATADENGFNGLPTGQILKPQVSHDLEIGATWGSVDRQLTAKWFRHRVRDEIYYDPTGGAFGFGANSNLDPTKHQGVELEGKLRVTEAVTVSATYQHVEAKFTEGVNAGKELALVPRNMLSTRVNWKSGSQSADAGLRWVDSQRYGSDFSNTCAARIPSYTTLDARYAIRVNAWEFALTGTNLAGRDYYSQAFSCQGSIYPENGRAVKFTARYDF
ncbi:MULTISPECIES: TonB-dependent receptor [unclassified Herbaspirillum]|uniref:TonB-dependent receptor n=1 Tax=unclassified Herbaspirillum TaxID=2624150 RepID=UPI0011732440|nr:MULTISPECIES: TonB-dependent receptor [unclassified Herbaspirillum]MBB5392106.1 iron complex outermembrane receptor protein [Herbaspirillum sp. SJZ102]TQK13563.1 iron complex outermembrane receptor protein [Herbaspirillum sp. SJZ130]TQK15566.1 iron complex outermembrane receptor protein [Herbaspirillum sp. SJZ106]